MPRLLKTVQGYVLKIYFLIFELNTVGKVAKRFHDSWKFPNWL